MIAILGKYFELNIGYWKLEEYRVKLLCVHLIPIIKLLFHTSPIRKLLFYTKIGALFCIIFFHENSLIMACCTFGELEIRSLTPNRFKSQPNDTFELLDYNYNHKQGYVTLKIFCFQQTF